jgi:hypothetical protein
LQRSRGGVVDRPGRVHWPFEVGQTNAPPVLLLRPERGNLLLNLDSDAVGRTKTSGLNLGLLWCGIQQADALQVVS